MAGTRSSARLASNPTSSPAKSQDDKTPTKTGSKRKANTDASPKAKRGKKAAPQKDQKTIEETMPTEGNAPDDAEMKEAADVDESTDGKADQVEGKGIASQRPSCWFWADSLLKPSEAPKADEMVKSAPQTESVQEPGSSGNVNEKSNEKVDGKADEEESAANGSEEATKQSAGDQPSSNTNGAVENDPEREKVVPSNILEKGIIYFFTRGRVGMEEPESVGDLQRTYFVLRPIPKGARLGDGPIEDLKNNRLFALPKKVFPKSQQDRFMAFVEKSNTTIQDLKENFFAGSEYQTKTTGTRHTPPVLPIGEGVYAFTQTERTTHLVYMLTIPSEPGEVQEEIGLRPKASFVTSIKNPERPGPAYAQLPEGPGFPKEILEEFHGLAWVPVQPKLLDYENTQILLIGEGTDGDVSKALEPSRKDVKHGDKETPQEELEKLEHEDELRVQHLHGDDSVFDDLRISQEEYSKVLTTW
ncbi:hypothetical protein H2201_001938 [Coniosporium apollinis]|uniref:BTB domain transcription factor n=1 Tax=Coniosporium apollinis TaxID=61459 RepID=A0ABQ9P028_9PEZI|nr:hypothetical protein H2201_001938 [Coniosporium apollinis]